MKEGWICQCNNEVWYTNRALYFRVSHPSIRTHRGLNDAVTMTGLHTRHGMYEWVSNTEKENDDGDDDDDSPHEHSERERQNFTSTMVCCHVEQSYKEESDFAQQWYNCCIKLSLSLSMKKFTWNMEKHVSFLPFARLTGPVGTLQLSISGVGK